MILCDRPVWPGHGRYWAHLVSDVSFAELHVFAELMGVPPRGFDRDHYDIPAERVPLAILLGATQVSTKEIAIRLQASGLRRPKHRPPAAT